ncbi:MAG TPA: hypothetical protein VFQ82_02735, partial [Stellaceae bacterium]|nr:hypothetical protein [Stellaceae bacterium]
CPVPDKNSAAFDRKFSVGFCTLASSYFNLVNRVLFRAGANCLNRLAATLLGMWPRVLRQLPSEMFTRGVENSRSRAIAGALLTIE